MKITRLICTLLMLMALPLNATASSWNVSIDDQSGLPVLTMGGANPVSTSYGFWSANWAWAGVASNLRIQAPFSYGLTATNKALGFDLSGQIEKTSERQLTWELNLSAGRGIKPVIGGGLVFKFDLTNFRAEMGDPELLPDNRGWAWGKKEQRVEVRFEPALASVYFERGNKAELRVFFYSGSIEQGRKSYRMTMSLAGDIAIVPTQTERYGGDAPGSWPNDTLDWKNSPVDLSFLNAAEKPAGKRGFVKTLKDRLVFEDATQARFWGTNLTAYTLFNTPREAVPLAVKRLSALGFNLVRLHHHDSPWVNPNIFGMNAADTRTLDQAALDRLDWWIKCLKDEGIYVWLDLHVMRELKTPDGIYAFDEIARNGNAADLKGYNYVNRSIQSAMKAFNADYLDRVNAYTGVRYADEAAIAALLITNENDVTHHFGNSLLPDKNVPKHNAIYMAEAKRFARSHVLPIDKTWHSWEHGPSKLFLNDLEQRFNVDMIKHLRSLGFRIPIVTTSTWGANPLSSLPALTTGDLVDVHAYGGTGELEKNPLVTSNLTHWLSAGQVVGMPMSVTEWNISPFPAPDRHAIPLYVASSASHQGWDAMMQYAYAQIPLNGPGSPSNWHAYNDPALIATLPAAALLYRQGHVREASTTYVYRPSKEQLFYQATTPANSVALRTAAERGKLLIAMPKTEELPWLEESLLPSGARVISDPNQSLLAERAAGAISDSGELRRNWDKGVFSIDTPRSQAAMGWVGGERIVLPNVEINVTTRNATVAVQSLDGKLIDKSDDILISLGARAVPESGNRMPFRAEPVEGNLIVRAPKGLKLYRQGVLQEKKLIPVSYRDGRYFIRLDKSLKTYWLTLRK
ncbi:MAG: glycosyl hydrolase family 5 [Hydrogenophilales bacterium 28-61-23]|nr:MAG: glycosyl hydrolase family 5 [Hydrogenophilales bacterium 28-61-23]